MHSSDPFLLQLLVIFLWAKIIGELFEQLRLPGVLGEILAGVILGPYATGFVEPSENIYSVAGIGAIFLLFTVGLETRPAELMHVGKRSALVAAGGVALPFVLGFAAMALAEFSVAESTFVAAALVATSVGITARVMGDMNVLHTRAAKIILGAAVADDILGMIILAVVAGLAATGSVLWLQLGTLLVEATAFALFMLFVAPRVIRRMEPGLERMSSAVNAPLYLALAICLGLSAVAEKIGMAAIIGAFFAGLAFADYAPKWNLTTRVSAITEFLAPFFFFTMGARLNLSVFTWDILMLAGIVSMLAVVSKVAGCGLPALPEGWKNALRIGVGMVPRGEVGLIVALVGLQAGVVTQQSYAVVVFMTAVTTLLAPPVLVVLFRELSMPVRGRRATDVAVGEPAP